MTQLGYLHLPKPFLRCCISLWKRSGPVQTVFALCERLPMTLTLSVRLWWLSHSKYWLVCMGLWYTVMDKEMSASGLTKVSRKGIESILLITFYCKPNCWIYIINRIQEQLFMGLLLEDKSVIYKPRPIPRGCRQTGDLLSKNASFTCLPLLGLPEIP